MFGLDSSRIQDQAEGEEGRVVNLGNRLWRPESRCGSTVLHNSKRLFYITFGPMVNRHEIWSSQLSHCHYGEMPSCQHPKGFP